MNFGARASWRGDARVGGGDLTTVSKWLLCAPSSYSARFEGRSGLSPEELIAAAHAGCFNMALATLLQAAGYTSVSLETEAIVTLERRDGGLRISRSALRLAAAVPGVDPAVFEELAFRAEAGCPVSKLLNTDISLIMTLVVQ